MVRAGLRLLENSENKLQVLRQMLAAGEQSGLADYTYSSLVTELDEESNTDIQGDLWIQENTCSRLAPVVIDKEHQETREGIATQKWVRLL